MAVLLPKATTVEPNLSTSLIGIFAALANLANSVAASSAVRLVATPKFIIVLVNEVISCFLIPSCPAASATPAISVAANGIVLLILVISLPILFNSLPLILVVLATPAKACSQSIEDLIAVPIPATAGIVI